MGKLARLYGGVAITATALALASAAQAQSQAQGGSGSASMGDTNAPRQNLGTPDAVEILQDTRLVG
ncbi:MAG: hypothetical protein V4464_03045, partial [Pseudomonadota bacterium]